MTKKIFFAIVSVCTAVLAAAVILAALLLYDDYADAAANRVMTEARLIASAVGESGAGCLDEMDFGRNIRVTLTGADGSMLYDSASAAFSGGGGIPSSASDTIMQSKVSHSVALNDGSAVCVSASYDSLAAKLAEMINPMLLILAAAVLFSALSASLVSRRIAGNLNEIEPARPDSKKMYGELAPLLEKLRSRNVAVSRQMNEIQQSREQFSLITETMSEGLIIADRRLSVIVCNSAAKSLLGAGSFTEGQSIYALNNSDVFRRCLVNALGGRRSDCILRTGSGLREVIASPANSIDVVCGIVVFIMDVTEKQELETMRREFTSNVSHELKTPLTTIYGISDMLANGMVQQEDVRRFGGDIRSEADRLINLINDIVSLSKLDEDSVPRENESVELYGLAEEVLDRLKLGAEEKGVTAALTGERVSLSGNRTILSEILYNLCDNAIKYNISGGSLDVKISHIPQMAIVTVSDTGTGIPKQYMGRIFERFYRADKSRSQRIKGTGLGLSIVKHGVIYHKGNIRVESEEGRGTVFTVELPIEKNKEVYE